MSWLKRSHYKLGAILLGCFLILGCGVKGDPLPPEKPVELGRGRPTYKRATEGMQIEKAKPRQQDEEEENGEEEDEDRE